MIRLSFIFICWTFSFSAWGQSYCVSKPAAKLRAAPSTKAAISWRVPKFMPLMGTGKKQGPWVEVKDVDGEIHWANKSDVTTRLKCLVVKLDSTRLRAGPGKKFDLAALGVVEKYSSFLDLGGEDGWTQVEDDGGEKAWINIDHTWRPAKKIRLSLEN